MLLWSVKGGDQRLVDLSGDVAFEAAHDLFVSSGLVLVRRRA